MTAKVIRVDFRVANKEKAYELYVRGCEIDETNLEEAEFLYREAIRLDPYLDLAYTNLGNVRHHLGFHQEARELYLKALELDPQQPSALYNVGYMLVMEDQCEQALPYLKLAVDNDSEFRDALFTLAMALRRTGNTSAAKPYWRRFLDLEPTGTYANIARAELGLRVVKHRAPKPAP